MINCMTLTKELLQQVNKDIEEMVKKYQDYSVSELLMEFNINATAKNRLNLLIKRMILYSNSVHLTQIENMDNVSLKTIKLDKYRRLKESMSFPTFHYCDIVHENWENSLLRKTFKDKTFIFVLFKNGDKELYLNKIILWKMPETVLEKGIRPVWEKTKECLLSGNVVKYIDDNGRYFTYFPSSTENPYVHVRPHAQDRQDTFPLPIQDKLTGLIEYPKHSFWLNKSYILKIISKDE